MQKFVQGYFDEATETYKIRYTHVPVKGMSQFRIEEIIKNLKRLIRHKAQIKKDWPNPPFDFVKNEGVCQYLEDLDIDIKFHIAAKFNPKDIVWPIDRHQDIHTLWFNEKRWEYINHCIKELTWIKDQLNDKY